MNRKPLRPFVPMCLVVAVGFLYLMSREVLVLELEDRDRPQTMRIAVRPSEQFSLSYVHSVYDAPVTEDFQVEDRRIVLTAVRTRSYGVMKDYGIAEGPEVHPLHVPLGSFVLMVGPGAGQELIVRHRHIFLSKLGNRGDRVQLRIVPMPFGSYLLSTRSGKRR